MQWHELALLEEKYLFIALKQIDLGLDENMVIMNGGGRVISIMTGQCMEDQ